MSSYVLSLYLDFTSRKLEKKYHIKQVFSSYLKPDFISAPLDASQVLLIESRTPLVMKEGRLLDVFNEGHGTLRD
jgi:hypothetical protein